MRFIKVVIRYNLKNYKKYFGYLHLSQQAMCFKTKTDICGLVERVKDMFVQ